MTKVVIDMSMSLDGFVASPEDSVADPLGRHSVHLFDWYSSGDEEYCDPCSGPSRVPTATRSRACSPRAPSAAGQPRRTWPRHEWRHPERPSSLATRANRPRLGHGLLRREAEDHAIMPQYNRLDADQPGSEAIVRESDEAIARESAGRTKATSTVGCSQPFLEAIALMTCSASLPTPRKKPDDIA
jgi:hypothetical protein